MKRTFFAGWIAVAGATLTLSCHHEVEKQSAKPSSSAAPVRVEPRAQLLATYPCTQCHEGRTPRPARYTLTEFHRIRNEDLAHGDSKAWCYQCHAMEDINRLKLANGSLVTFDEAYALCISCHGDKRKDFESGVHGQTTGYWNATKYRRSCPACHDPHKPAFPAMEPEKPPAPPHPRDSLSSVTP